jgi:putative transposase
VELDYLFVDASHFKMHDGARSEPVLVAYGITTTGDPVFLHLDGVSAESTDACVAFLEDMVARGLSSPVLSVSDGAPGLCAALDQVFPAARRQRCLIHRARNCIVKVAEVDQDAVRGDYWDIFDLDDTFTPGEAAVAEARRRAGLFASTWGRAYPGAVACVTGGFDELAAHLHFPRAHWPRIRHTNLIERTFGETRRRVKVIGRLPGERSALSLLWAVLDRAAAGWRGITYTPADVRLLQMIRRDLGLTRRTEPRPDDTPGGDVAAAA